MHGTDRAQSSAQFAVKSLDEVAGAKQRPEAIEVLEKV